MVYYPTLQNNTRLFNARAFFFRSLRWPHCANPEPRRQARVLRYGGSPAIFSSCVLRPGPLSDTNYHFHTKKTAQKTPLSPSFPFSQWRRQPAARSRRSTATPPHKKRTRQIDDRQKPKCDLHSSGRFGSSLPPAPRPPLPETPRTRSTLLRKHREYGTRPSCLLLLRLAWGCMEAACARTAVSYHTTQVAHP